MQNGTDQAIRHERQAGQAPTCYPAIPSPVASLLLSLPPSPLPPLPYTPDMHSARCAVAARARVVLVQHVQVSDRCGSQCGRIAGLWTTPDGVDLWVVDLLGGGRTHVPARRVTQCSHLDDRCICAGESVAGVQQ